MRQPETNHAVYELGHYEQMAINKALAYSAPGSHYLTADEQDTVAALVRVFAGHGTVTIIRRDDG